MTLDLLLGAADSLRGDNESIGLSLVERQGRHRVKLVIGGEVQLLVSAPTRAEAITKALAELGR